MQLSLVNVFFEALHAYWKFLDKAWWNANKYNWLVSTKMVVPKLEGHWNYSFSIDDPNNGRTTRCAQGTTKYLVTVVIFWKRSICPKRLCPLLSLETKSNFSFYFLHYLFILCCNRFTMYYIVINGSSISTK